MNEERPYNQFDDLPLPDQQQAWKKMEEKLDEKEKKRRILPPLFLRSCAGWGFALLLVTAATWMIVKPGRRWQKKEIAKQEQTVSKQKELKAKIPSTVPDLSTGNKNSNETENEIDEKKNDEVNPTNQHSIINPVVITKDEKLQSKQTEISKRQTVTHPRKKPISTSETKVKSQFTRKSIAKNTDVVIPDQKQKPGISDTASVSKTQSPVDETTKELVTVVNPKKIDEVKSSDSVFVKDSVTAEGKKKDQKPKKFIFSAGVGLQQQIPFSGQKAVPYDYYGRKGSVSDYLPSLYVRLEREKKWYLQGEFRYGAPQSLKEFSYSRQTKADTSLTNITTTTLRLKKTYYHQLPLSFNYYVRPNWSIGVGGMYSRFYGAVTEQEIKNKNVQTQAETTTKQILNIKHFNDSFLYKSQVHILLQTDYQWKRFSFGLRYTKDIQPYIKYTKPTGEINEEKNQTLQFILRYQLWRSGR